MSEHLFLYGTLRPEDAPEEIRSAVTGLRSVGEGAVPGLLYDLGEYPGAVIDAEAKQRIFGTVYQLPEDQTVLSRMDTYEDFRPAAPDESLFLRIRQQVEMDARGSVECWMYVYNQPLLGAPVVTGGRWRNRNA
jgi:gamma-glutamylcyclotransferase (GGCT)/AIG2-like uncharacterized protein YtfP